MGADPSSNAPLASMAPMKAMGMMKAMRAMKARGAAMTKGALAEALASQVDLKKSVCGKVIGTLADLGAGGVKSTGIFTLTEHLSFCPIGAQVACSPWGCPLSRSKFERTPVASRTRLYSHTSRVSPTI